MEKLSQQHPKIYKHFFTVTTFSKLLALGLFIILPFVGFYLGMKYQQMVTIVNSPIVSSVQKTAILIPTITQNPTKTSSIESWEKYTNPTYGYSFQYPTDWQANLLNQEFGMPKPVFKKDGYEVSFKEVFSRGGSVYRFIAKSEPVELYGLSLSKVYLNTSNRSCASDLPQVTTIPPSDCVNTFDTIFLTQSTDIKSVIINGISVPFIKNEIFYFPYAVNSNSHLGGGFNAQLTAPLPIKVSGISTNPYIDTYNHFVSTVDLAGAR
jgi:hypothetical protein